MEHKSVEVLRGLAEVRFEPPAPLSRKERLEAWAKALDRQSGVPVRLFHQLEFMPRAEWGPLRVEGSPLTIAYNDPLLRAQGLQSDRLGDAMAFFDMSERETHRMLCSCMHGASMTGSRAAGLVRQMASPLPHLAMRVGLGAFGASVLGLFLYMG
jgi:hypothetical protein